MNTITVTVTRSKNLDVEVTDDGDEFDDVYFYNDGEKSTVAMADDVECEIAERAAHYADDHHVVVSRRDAREDL